MFKNVPGHGNPHHDKSRQQEDHGQDHTKYEQPVHLVIDLRVRLFIGDLLFTLFLHVFSHLGCDSRRFCLNSAAGSSSG